ncbi:hypothetical protein C8R43DRAFT_1111115 [Mycena crocata]|nr:hypothetical protein C8R43DRAFT_1111115 [Mycena crocata]
MIVFAPSSTVLESIVRVGCAGKQCVRNSDARSASEVTSETWTMMYCALFNTGRSPPAVRRPQNGTSSSHIGGRLCNCSAIPVSLRPRSIFRRLQLARSPFSHSPLPVRHTFEAAASGYRASNAFAAFNAASCTYDANGQGTCVERFLHGFTSGTETITGTVRPLEAGSALTSAKGLSVPSPTTPASGNAGKGFRRGRDMPQAWVWGTVIGAT